MRQTKSCLAADKELPLDQPETRSEDLPIGSLEADKWDAWMLEADKWDA